MIVGKMMRYNLIYIMKMSYLLNYISIKRMKNLPFNDIPNYLNNLEFDMVYEKW